MANGVELGTAYLSLVASTKGLAPSVRKAMGGVEKEASGSGKRAGLGWIGGAAKVMGGAAVAGVGLVAGAAITKGFKRSIQLQDSKAKLEGLGMSAKDVTKTMDSALAAVKGTAFGLGEAATVAASMTAAGVKPGKDLQRSLTLVGDAATIAGTDMGTMGAIFGKVAASNKVQMDVINQLHDAGVPALSLLADQMGVTAEEASKMASKGEIDFATFQAAMEKGLGGAAQKSGETFTGALANMGAALGRLGALFTGPIVEHAPGLFTAITGAIDTAGEALAPFAESFGKWLGPTLERVSGYVEKIDFKKLFDSMKSGLGPLTTLATALSPIGIILKGMAPVLPQIGDSLAAIGKAVGGVLAAVLPALATAFADIGEALAGAISAALPSLVPLFEALASVIPSITPALVTLVRVFAALVVQALKLATPILASETAVKALVGAFLAWKVITGIVAAVRGALALFKAVQLGVTASTYGASGAMVVAGASAKVYGAIMKAQAITTKAVTIAQRALNLVMRANPIGLIITAVTALVGALVWFFTKTKLGKKIIAAAWSGIKSAIKGVADWWTGTAWPAISRVINWFQGAFNTAKAVIGVAWAGIKKAAGDTWAWIKKWVFLPFRIYIAAWKLAFKAAKTVIAAAWSGIKAAAKTVWNWIRDNVFAKMKAALIVLRAAFNLAKGKITAAWNLIKAGLKAGWHWIRDNVFARIKTALENMRTRFNTAKTVVTTAWNRIRDGLKAGWHWIRDNVFSKIKSGIGAVKDAFRKAKDGIKIIWNKIKKIVAAPINFMIEKVYGGAKGATSGIRPLVGKVFKWLGKDNPLPVMNKVQFARGGWTGRGSKYTPAGIVHADEFVVKKSSRRKFERSNPGALDYINRTGRMPGYANGGIVAAANWWRKLGATASEHPAFGGVSYGAHMKNSLHYSGNAVDLNKGAGTSSAEQSFFDRHLSAFRMAFPNIHVLWRVADHFNHMHIDTSRGGSRIGRGGSFGGGGLDPFSIIRKLKALKDKFSGDLFSGGLGGMVKSIGGKIINGPIQWIKDQLGKFGDDGKGHAYTGNTDVQKRVRAVAMKYGWGLGNQWAALDWIINKESGWNPTIKNPTSSAMGLFQKMTSIHGPLEKTIEGQAKWGLNYIKSRYGTPLAAQAHHQAKGWYADGGRVLPKLYDQGGWLPRGLSVVENRTSKPERILNEDQWDRMTSQNQGPLIGQLVVRDEKTAVREFRREQQRMRVRNNMAGR